MPKSHPTALSLRHLLLQLLGSVLLLIALPGCSSSDWFVELRLGGLTDEIVKLSVSVNLNGQSAVTEVTRSLDHFSIRLVSAMLGPGLVTIDISALGTDGCQRAAASVSASVPAEGPIDAMLSPSRGCRVVVARSGTGTGQVSLGDGTLGCQLDGKAKPAADPTCQADPSDGPDACAFCLPIDTAVQLVPYVDPGFYFSGFGGGCRGRECAFPVTSGIVRVQATFVPKLVCSIDHVCWENPLPAKLGGAHMFARTTDDAWLFGEGGLILHWNGVVWLPQASSVVDDLSSGWGSASDDLWVVGGERAIHWDGSSFTPFRLKVENVLIGVAGGPSGVWAIGDSGEVFRWDATSWQLVGKIDGFWSAISQSPDGEIWIVGTTAAFRGILIHWDQQTLGDLSQLTSYSVGRLTGVWAAGHGEAFAVGQDSILHFQNGALEMDVATELARNPGASTVWGSRPSDVWVGLFSGSVRHFDGTKWTDVYINQNALLNLSGTRPDDIWLTDVAGNLLRWNGAYWLPQLASITDVDLRAIAGAGADFHVAGGPSDSGQGIILHGYGESWEVPSSLDSDTAHAGWNAVWALDQSHLLFAGKGGKVLSWDTAGVPRSWNPTTHDLFAIWGASAGEVYAAGDAATLIKYDGTSWSQVTNPSFDPKIRFTGLGGGKVNGTTELWIVGEAGEIWRGDGTNFSRMSLPSELYFDPDFHGVFWNAKNDVWFAGDQATLLHWNGTGFALIEIEDIFFENVLGVWSSGAGEAWAVGDFGGIWHFSGSAPVSRLHSGTLSSLYGVHGNVQNGQVELAFVGGQGTILRYRP